MEFRPKILLLEQIGKKQKCQNQNEKNKPFCKADSFSLHRLPVAPHNAKPSLRFHWPNFFEKIQNEIKGIWKMKMKMI
jgi:hypothetical protein